MAVDTMNELSEVCVQPNDRAGQRVLDHQDVHCRSFIGLSPLYVIASARGRAR